MDDKPRFSEKEIWEKYLELTKDLLKFIDQEEIDTFLDMVDQRQQLMEMLQALPDHEFARSPEGVALREQIKPMDMQIMYKARSWLNKSKRNNTTVRGYDSFGLASSSMFNREY
ncbi:flagellar protein FliT [uncultured Anaerovibrio sp.]|uniref:flagellar protein FliT n=1 Tax=uncultured Anaerovibrio sp. TaxID=361586 RepID=UPI0026273E09|nr:flagellar protein FliT [uncultured Anaerovibrio sp.]